MKINFLKSAQDISKIEYDFLFPVRYCLNDLKDMGYDIFIRNKVDKYLEDCDVLVILSRFMRYNRHNSELKEKLKKIAERVPVSCYFEITDSAGGIDREFLNFCDYHFRKQIYRDRSFYIDPKAKDSRMHFDFFIRNFNADYAIEPINDMNPDIFKKIRLAWNVGVGDYRSFMSPSSPLSMPVQYLQYALMKRPLYLPFLQNLYYSFTLSERNLDIIACFSPYNSGCEPIKIHRKLSLEAVLSLREKFKIVHGFLKRAEYYRVMRRAKICVSPFGWGEFTWKDIESWMFGLALLKPDFSEIDTWPQYFIKGKTYIPYSWDASDLPQVLKQVLIDRDVLENVAVEGQKRFKHFCVLHNKEPFLERFNEIFSFDNK